MAAAQEARDELLLDLGNAIGEGGDWTDWLDLPDGALPDGGAAAAADQLAADNDSTVTDFAPYEVGGYPGFQVRVRTNYAVGDSIVPGTESKQAEADAVAVIQPRCAFDLGADPKQPLELDCDGEPVDIDPEDFDPDDLPDASVMFSVHLAE